MQLLGTIQRQPYRTRLQEFKELAEEAARISPDMREPEWHTEMPLIRLETGKSVSAAQAPCAALERGARNDAAVLSREDLIRKYGHTKADAAIRANKSQAPTLKQSHGKRQRMYREANAEFGKALVAAGIHVHQHSERDYAHVIVTQLNLFQEGAIPSVSAVVNAAFPDNPKKATSIKNSQHGKRRKKAWNSPAVMNHPMEKTMLATHGQSSMNQRNTPRTFGQSLGMNATLFKNCDRITKLEARVQLLERQMQSTKQREALADAGCSTSREKVLALYDQGKRQTEIARLLDMSPNTVKSILQRSKEH